MKPAPPPADLIRLTTVLDEHPDEYPALDLDHPTIPIWVVEANGELWPWVLVAVGERTVTVMDIRDRHHRELRQHGHVWVRPSSLIAWRLAEARGYARQDSVTWNRRIQGARGRSRALALRKEAAEA